MGRVCSKVVLCLIIWNSRDSVKLGNLSRYFTKAVLTVKYIVNFEFAFSHAAKRFKTKMTFCFTTTITQNTSVYQNMWVAGYSGWYVIVNVAYNVYNLAN